MRSEAHFHSSKRCCRGTSRGSKESLLIWSLWQSRVRDRKCRGGASGAHRGVGVPLWNRALWGGPQNPFYISGSQASWKSSTQARGVGDQSFKKNPRKNKTHRRDKGCQHHPDSLIPAKQLSQSACRVGRQWCCVTRRAEKDDNLLQTCEQTQLLRFPPCVAGSTSERHTSAFVSKSGRWEGQ